MKLIKKLRKGFTLIELVVVIAVIAVLAAVSVVSYVAITNKAKQSSDEQAVRQMNTALKASGILGAKDITDLFNILSEEGMDAENYKPLAKDTYFFWDQENNEIVYAKYKDGQYVGIYPESYKDQTKGEHHWFSLSKTIKKVDVKKNNEGKYEVKSAEELYTIVTDQTYNAQNITLKNDVDLMGADITFSGVETIDGGNKTMSNLSQLQHQSFDNSQKENSNSGLLGYVNGGTVVVKDLIIENSVVGSESTKFCGIIGGKVDGGADVTIQNVKIRNCTVYALQKGGTLFGYVSAGKITVASDVEITGCKVATLYGEGGKLIGAMQKKDSSGVASTYASNLVNNMNMEKLDVTLESLPTDLKVEIKSSIATVAGKNVDSGYMLYNKNDAKNFKENSDKTIDFSTQVQYTIRYFNKDSIVTLVDSGVVYGTTPITVGAVTLPASIEGLGTEFTAKAKMCLPLLPSMIA